MSWGGKQRALRIITIEVLQATAWKQSLAEARYRDETLGGFMLFFWRQSFEVYRLSESRIERMLVARGKGCTQPGSPVVGL